MNERGKHEGCVRGYVISREAWWYDPHRPSQRDAVHEVLFGFYDPDGGSSGEMNMRWYALGRQVAPRLEVFSDGWDALHEFGLVPVLAQHDNTNPSVDEFVDILRSLGFEDQTPRTRPLPATPHDSAVPPSPAPPEGSDEP